MAKKVLYFAYGSNMCFDRLRGRTPNAKFYGIAEASDKNIVFNKKSDDCSSKANLEDCPLKVVRGVLYAIDKEEFQELKKCEKGYDEEPILVTKNDGLQIEARTFVARKISVLVKDVKPYSWYKDLILCGAREHGLLSDYIACLERIESKDDPNPHSRNKC